MLPEKVTKEIIIKIPSKIELDLRIIGFLLFILIGSSFKLMTISPSEKIVMSKVYIRDTVKVKEYPIQSMINKLKGEIKKSEPEIIHTGTPKGVPLLFGTYTPYQVLMYHLKAHESFNPEEYPDGDYPSKGFGLNLTPEHVRWASKILGFNCRSRDWTYAEARLLLEKYCEQMIDQIKKDHPNANPFQIIALAIHKYNTGNTRNLYGCCGARKGCGKPCNSKKNCNIKASHNARRRIESALFHGHITKSMIEADQKKAAKLNSRWKGY